MVTKGYRKGVYDRVTEGTWELEPVWESVVSSSRLPTRVVLKVDLT